MDSESQASSGLYGLRRTVVPSKRLRDYCLEGEISSKSSPGVKGRKRKQVRPQSVSTVSTVCSEVSDDREPQAESQCVSTESRGTNQSLQELKKGDKSSCGHSDCTAEDSESRASSGLYGLRRTVVSSKRLRDYCLEGEISSKSSPGVKGQKRKQVRPQSVSTVSTVCSEVSDHREPQAEPQCVSTESRGTNQSLQELKKGDKSSCGHSDCTAETTVSSSSDQLLTCDAPLLIHGHTIPEYQKIYHSVVDRVLYTSTGQARPYSLELGRRIKQRLWEELHCPSLTEELQSDGQLGVTETFRTPTLRSYTPLIEVDISGEPLPDRPKKRRRQ